MPARHPLSVRSNARSRVGLGREEGVADEHRCRPRTGSHAVRSRPAAGVRARRPADLRRADRLHHWPGEALLVPRSRSVRTAGRWSTARRHARSSTSTSANAGEAPSCRYCPRSSTTFSCPVAVSWSGSSSPPSSPLARCSSSGHSRVGRRRSSSPSTSTCSLSARLRPPALSGAPQPAERAMAVVTHVAHASG